MGEQFVMNIFGNRWAIKWYPGKFEVQKGFEPDCKKKIVKVEDDLDFTYKLQKTKVKAIDGSEGLYDFMIRWYKDRFGLSRIETILNYIMDEMREA